MDLFGLGKAASTAIVVAALLGAGGVAVKCTVDAIGDAREERLRKESLEDRLQGIRDGNERERQAKELPRLAKIWCAVDGAGSACCKPDAVRLPRCTHAPDSSEKRPD